MTATPAQSQEPAAPPLVSQINNGNWLAQEEAEELRAELCYQRAGHAYMTMLPAMNVIGMRDGSEASFGPGYNVQPIWKDRMDSRRALPPAPSSGRFPGRDFLVALRLYGAQSAFYDQTWKPDDIVKVE